MRLTLSDVVGLMLLREHVWLLRMTPRHPETQTVLILRLPMTNVGRMVVDLFTFSRPQATPGTPITTDGTLVPLQTSLPLGVRLAMVRPARLKPVVTAAILH